MARPLDPQTFATAARMAQDGKNEREEVPSTFGTVAGSPDRFAVAGKRYAGDAAGEVAKAVERTRNFGAVVKGIAAGAEKAGPKGVQEWVSYLEKGPFSLMAEQQPAEA